MPDQGAPRLVDVPRPKYCETVKNITVTVDDETYRKARIRAAERETSLSAIVKRALQDLAADESDFDRSKRRERELRESIRNFSAADRLDRNAAHERR
jgi:hypothetical protein